MDIVRIDFFKNGLKIYMDSDASFKDIRYELIRKLEPVKKFLKDATAAIKIEGRILNDEEEKALYEIVSNHTEFNIACIFYDDEDSIKVFEKIIKVSATKPVTDYVEITRVAEDNGHTFSNKNNKEKMADHNIVKEKNENINDHRNVVVNTENNIEKNILEQSGNLVIYGNVEKGETVVSEKSIYVLGSLLGEAYAGIKNKNSSGKEDAIIFAMEFAPEQIGISEQITKPKAMNHVGLGNKNKYIPCISYMKNGTIKTVPFTKDLINLLQ